MKKYKFTILKHTLYNGRVYYKCRVKVYHPLRWTVSGILVYLTNFNDHSEYLDMDGDASVYYAYNYEKHDDVLQAIHKYLTDQHKRDGEQITTIETEIIWK